jgi:hypothetical protein
VPAGWELFIASFQLNSGTITFYTRTAATSGGLSAATWIAVTNGQFIPNTAYAYIQYKAVLVSSADANPSIDSVTINWFISVTSSIRVASAFFNANRSYYLAAATYGSTVNNLVLKLEENGTWKIYKDVSINTFSFFFNDLYYGSQAGNTVLFNTGLTDLGAAITMDIRMPVKIIARKNNDLDDRVKILRDITARVIGTGATYEFYYSTDLGATWTLMADPTTGLTNFPTVNDGNPYAVRMVPVVAIGDPMASGRTLLIRVVDTSANSAQLRSLKARVWIREQEVLTHNG